MFGCNFISKIIIGGIRGQSYAGDIAVDDFWIDDSPCPPEGCSFAFNILHISRTMLLSHALTLEWVINIMTLLFSQEVVTLRKRVSVLGSMCPMETSQ